VPKADRPQSTELKPEQVDRAKAVEPEYKSKIIDTLNKQCATSSEGNIFLRLPPTVGLADGMFCPHTWTKAETDRYLHGDGKLPVDLSSIKEDHKTIPIYIFDARHGNGKELPEVDVAFVPDFEKLPGLCIFDIASASGPGNTALIPSEFLEVVPKAEGRVLFKLTGRA
jgi:hypothetical protein